MECCLRIKGRVQGVGFRFWAVRKANAIGGISGYIYNEGSGDVLTLISGEEEAVKKMMLSLYKGPLLARVDSVENAIECRSYFPQIQNGVFKRI